MEVEKIIVEKKDCDFVYIVDVENSLSEGNRSWIFCNSVFLPSAKIDFLTDVGTVFILPSFLISKLSFYSLSCDGIAIWLSKLSSTVGHILPNPRLYK